MNEYHSSNLIGSKIYVTYSIKAQIVEGWDVFKGNVRVYIERMRMSARYYSIAHAYESIFEIYLKVK